MAYHDVNSEGLTFSEWVQAAGYYKPDPKGGPTEGAETRDCAPYSRSNPYYVGFDREGNEAALSINLIPNGGRVVRRSGTRVFFSRKLRDAWRNSEDPSEYRQEAPKRKTYV